MEICPRCGAKPVPINDFQIDATTLGILCMSGKSPLRSKSSFDCPAAVSVIFEGKSKKISARHNSLVWMPVLLAATPNPIARDQWSWSTGRTKSGLFLNSSTSPPTCKPRRSSISPLARSKWFLQNSKTRFY